MRSAEVLQVSSLMKSTRVGSLLGSKCRKIQPLHALTRTCSAAYTLQNAGLSLLQHTRSAGILNFEQ